jgi:MFS family permease
MKTVSDHTLRWSASMLFGFTATMLGANVPLTLAKEPTGSWGSGPAVPYFIVAVTFPLVGLLIVRRQPRNTIGWVLMSIGGISGLGALAVNYAGYSLVVGPGSAPPRGVGVAAALAEGSWVPWIGLMGYLILVYPDGHLPSPRWRPVGWLFAVTIVIITVGIIFSPWTLEEAPVADLANPLGSQSAQPILTVLLDVFFPLLPLCFVACAIALALRFRRSRGSERLQLKWLAAAGAVVALVYLVTIVSVVLADLTAFVDERAGWITALQTMSLLSFALVPVAIGMAILRHRLYDIDVVINRALVYGSLTATLAGVYLGSVLLLQQVLSPLTNQSDLAIAGSTLAVAALFGPARARIQAAVDRRFYRRRYDAARIVDDFSSRLRDEIDVEAVGTDLRKAVHETVQPAHVSLWLRS